MAIQIKNDGIYVDGVLQIPSNEQYFIDKVYNKLVNNGIKTINGESILGTGNINIQSKILQVITLTNNEMYYFNTKQEVELPGLNTYIKPVSNKSKFLVFGTVLVTNFYVGSVAIKFGGAWINPPVNNNTSHNNSYYTFYTSNNYSTSYLTPINFALSFDNNVTTVKPLPIYFGVYVKNSWRDKAYKFYYNNRRENDMAGTSSVIVMEVAQ